MKFVRRWLLYLLEEVLKDGGDVMRREVREVHLLLLHLKGLTELLDARLGPAHTIYPLREKQKQKTLNTKQNTQQSFF